MKNIDIIMYSEISDLYEVHFESGDMLCDLAHLNNIVKLYNIASIRSCNMHVTQLVGMFEENNVEIDYNNNTLQVAEFTDLIREKNYWVILK